LLSICETELHDTQEVLYSPTGPALPVQSKPGNLSAQ